jgi:hypothetical protein
MKRSLLLLVMFLTASVSICSQSKMFIKFGLNSSSYWGENSEGSKEKDSYMLGIGLESQIEHSNISVAPAFEIISKGCKGVDNHNNEITVNAVYFEVPVDFIYHLRVVKDNYITFAAGPYIACGISGDTSDNNNSIETFNEWTGLDRLDMGINFGMGYEYKRLLLNGSCDLGLKKIAYNSPKNISFIISMGIKI